MHQRINFKTEQGIAWRAKSISWGLVLIVFLCAGVGFLSLYSAAGGSFSPWADKQIIRFFLGLMIMTGIALVDLKLWYKSAWFFYILGIVLLVIVEVMGKVGMGAQRWINLGVIQLQPSELMKIAVVMVLARYFHSKTLEDMRSFRFLVPAAFIVLLPIFLVLLQPDLGTSIMIALAGGAMFFIAGAPIWLFLAFFVIALTGVPIAWHFMHAYQKQRVMTFLDPESDPLGAGYHITQSKIALGSGGVEGKGFLEGTQSRLNFLPEKQTDFIFTLWAEEWGLLGGLFLLFLFGAVFFYGLVISKRCRTNFARYLSLGLTVNFSLYVFINISMVMGLIPVVGAPLPLVSYGGTSMLAALIGFGLIMSCNTHRDMKVMAG